MKNLLRLEEIAQFVLVVLALVMKSAAWWVYLLLLLGPDVGMLGYLIGPRTGAACYNFAHHKGVALLVLFIGFAMEIGNMLTNVHSGFLLAGLILYGHSSMDRMLGYGLKYSDDFKHTHLGWIGRKNNMQEQEQEQ